MGVNFFRFPFGSRRGGGEGGNRREPQAEELQALEEILKNAEFAMECLCDPQNP